MPSEPAPAPDPSRAIDGVVRGLLRATYGLFPDDLMDTLTGLVDEHVPGTEITLLLVDLDQVDLHELTSDGTGGATESVEDSHPGLAFRTQEPVVEAPDPSGRRRAWLPVLDSAERLGVLGVVDDGDVPLDDWLVLTSMLGELVMSKETYGDLIARTRRRSTMSLAAEMRWSMLPPLTFSSPQVGVAGVLQPSHLVAGDAFDYAVSTHCAIVGVFDAMGHGLQASRLANIAIGGFRNARRNGLSALEGLELVDLATAAQFGKGRFTTAQVVTLDLDDGLATILTAGHPPPLLLRPEGPAEVVPVRPGLPLGLGPSSYEPTELRLEPGEALLLHSDGLYEGRNPAGEEFGTDRMLEMAGELFRAGLRPSELVRRLARAALDFQEGDILDDTTAALVRYRPSAVGQPAAPSAEHATHLS